MWIDSDSYENNIGDTRYLVKTLNTSTGRISYSLYERPLRTNQSGQPRLLGWCGETDNRSRYAEGVWRVEEINKAGDRARIRKLNGAELREWLEADGYPELMDCAHERMQTSQYFSSCPDCGAVFR